MARMRRTTALAALGSLLSVAGALALVGGAASAGAATANPPSSFVGWGTDLAGTPGAYATEPALFGVGYPKTVMSSDSNRTASIPRGMSTWWGSQTPAGKYWGSSHDKSFLSVRPASDEPGSASTTTISFADAAPTGWGFVVGDVDSETVTVTGMRADGQPASSEDLGFRGTFNACATADKMDSCPAVAGKAPAWDVDALTLTGSSDAADSIGADGWFVPRARLQSVTLSSTWEAGQPVFQTWLVTRTNNLSGTVSVSDGLCDLTQATVTLVGAEGEALKTTQVAEDGTWSFGQVAATDDFGARLTRVPPGCRTDDGLKSLSLALAGDRADFTVAQIPGTGVAVTGTVKDDENLPVQGAKVTLSVGSISVSTTTGKQGRFTLPGLPPNIAPTGKADSWYTVRLTPPGGLVQVGTLPDQVYVDAVRGVADTLDFIVEGTRLTAPSGPTTSLPTTVPTSPPTSSSSPTATSSATTTSAVTSATSGATPYSAAAAYTSAASSPTTSSLASTGGPARVVLLAGLALLAAGAATLVGSRRRA